MQNCRYSGLCQWVSESHSVLSDSLWPHGLYSPWNSPGQNTGVGGLSLLQGIFPTQGSNPGLPHFRQILYQLNYKGSPKIGWNDLLISIRQESCKKLSFKSARGKTNHGKARVHLRGDIGLKVRVYWKVVFKNVRHPYSLSHLVKPVNSSPSHPGIWIYIPKM